MSIEHEESGQQPLLKSKFQGRPVFLMRVVGMAAVSMLLILAWSGCDVSGTSTTSGLQPGDSAPPILASGWLNGEPLTPEDLKGKVVVLNAWFSQ